MEWYWIVLIAAGGVFGVFVLLGLAATLTVNNSWGRLVDLASAGWYLVVFGYTLVLLGGAVVASAQASRPFAAVAAWLIGFAALLTVWAFWPPRSGRAFVWCMLLVLAGLAFVATDLAVEGRAVEIALWIPVIGAAFVGFLYVMAGLADGEAERGIRVLRVAFGLILLGLSYGIAAAFVGWDLWDLVF